MTLSIRMKLAENTVSGLSEGEACISDSGVSTERPVSRPRHFQATLAYRYIPCAVWIFLSGFQRLVLLKNHADEKPLRNGGTVCSERAGMSAGHSSGRSTKMYLLFASAEDSDYAGFSAW